MKTIALCFAANIPTLAMLAAGVYLLMHEHGTAGSILIGAGICFATTLETKESRP